VFGGQPAQSIGIIRSPTIHRSQVAALSLSKLAQRCGATLCFRIDRSDCHRHTDTPHSLKFLRARASGHATTRQAA
jgi:hypothetical protein